jgi:hypothetical protein
VYGLLLALAALGSLSSCCLWTASLASFDWRGPLPKAFLILFTKRSVLLSCCPSSRRSGVEGLGVGGKGRSGGGSWRLAVDLLGGRANRTDRGSEVLGVGGMEWDPGGSRGSQSSVSGLEVQKSDSKMPNGLSSGDVKL